MILDLLTKIFITPENIIGLLLNITGIVGMCLIFTLFNEKWWKSIVPFYGTFVLYKHTWKRYSGAFATQTLFALLEICSMSFFKKHITRNLFYAVKSYIETEQWDLDISIPKLLIASALFILSTFIVWIFGLITYVKICNKLNVKNVLLIIGVLFFPDIFLIITYLYYKRKNRGEKV